MPGSISPCPSRTGKSRARAIRAFTFRSSANSKNDHAPTDDCGAVRTASVRGLRANPRVTAAGARASNAGCARNDNGAVATEHKAGRAREERGGPKTEEKGREEASGY